MEGQTLESTWLTFRGARKTTFSSMAAIEAPLSKVMEPTNAASGYGGALRNSKGNWGWQSCYGCN